MRLIPISLSTAIVLHEVLSPLHHEAVGPQPHIDSEIKTPDREKAIVALARGSSGTEELPGHFRQRTLYQKSLRVKKYRNKREQIEMLEAYVDTARELAATYPRLKQWERQMHFQMFQSDIKMLIRRSRGCKNFSAALPLVAMHLGVFENYNQN
jgi:hypothetical protein